MLPLPGPLCLQGPCSQLAVSTSQPPAPAPQLFLLVRGQDRVRYLDLLGSQSQPLPCPHLHEPSPPYHFKGRLEGHYKGHEGQSPASREAYNEERLQAWRIRSLGSYNEERLQAWRIRSLGSWPSLACSAALDKSPPLCQNSLRQKSWTQHLWKSLPALPLDLQYSRTFKGMGAANVVCWLVPNE